MVVVVKKLPQSRGLRRQKVAAESSSLSKSCRRVVIKKLLQSHCLRLMSRCLKVAAVSSSSLSSCRSVIVVIVKLPQCRRRHYQVAAVSSSSLSSCRSVVVVIIKSPQSSSSSLSCRRVHGPKCVGVVTVKEGVALFPSFLGSIRTVSYVNLCILFILPKRISTNVFYGCPNVYNTSQITSIKGAYGFNNE